MSFIANTTSENGIVITPRAYKIDKAIITANNGKEYNLLPTIHNIEIHEGMRRTGYYVRLFIEDAANLTDELKMALVNGFNDWIELIKKSQIEYYVAFIPVFEGTIVTFLKK